MERPLPRKSAGNAERFDLISCSLVLNFVPGAVQRGEMLKRFSKFFKNASTGGAGNAKRSSPSSGGEAKRAKNGPSTDGRDTAKREHGEDSLEAEVKEDSTRVPLLFVVLPLPCVTNSRYCTEELFLEIMASLGYVVRAQRAAVKVGYWLFEWCGTNGDIRLKGKTRTTFPKKELVAGGKRNNFCIVLE